MPDANEILSNWEAACEAATEPPWHVIEDGTRDLWADEDYVFDGQGKYRHPMGITNLEFAAQARTGWPATIRALMAAVHGLSRISGESNDETMGLVADDSLAEIQAILEGRDA